MAKPLRYLGWALLVVAGLFLGHDLVLLLPHGHWDPASLGQVWGWIHEPSRNAVRAQVDKLLPPLGPIARDVLTWPVCAVFGVPGLLLTLSGRRQLRRGGWGR
jgi:hypothetical protein